MNQLMPGLVLGCMIYVGWMGFYFLYVPKRIKKSIESSMPLLFIMDVMLTVLGTIGMSAASGTLTAAFGGATIACLGTITSLVLRGKRKLYNLCSN